GACALLLGGCASVPPSAEELNRLPVVQFGEPVPAGGDYILFFPADKPIPVDVAVRGSIFAREAEERLCVGRRKGIYSYKNWVSSDRVTWRKGQEAIKTDIRIVLPSHAHPEAGSMKVQMDEQR